MEMKKILQAIDGQSTKPQAEVGDMARFVSIIAEGTGLRSETVALNTYNEKTSSSPKLIDRYFKQVEEEFSEGLAAKQEKVKHLAERASRQVGNYGHQSSFAKHVQQSKSPSDRIVQMAKSSAKVSNRNGYRVEETDPVDTVTLDIPLLLRIMEYSKEDAQDDMALHDVTQRLIELSKKVDVINMDHYDAIVSGNVDESLRTDNPCWKGYKPVGTKKKGGRTVPNCVPK
jgi:hypothetical protein